MFSLLNFPAFRLTATARRFILLATITIGISIQLAVPEGVTVSDIAVSARTTGGTSLALPHSATITSGRASTATAPNSSTTLPGSATAISAPTSATAPHPKI